MAVRSSLPASRAAIAGIAIVVAIAAGCSQGAGATASPPASTATTQVMGSGTFHDVDGSASGEAMLVVTPDGAYEVVFENFKTGSIAHTNVVLVSNADVTKSADVDKTKLLDLGPLKGTEGMQDFPIPAAMASSVMDGYHTVVLWDTEMAHAVAAAALK